MKIVFEMKLSLHLIHKLTGKEFYVDNSIHKELNEGTKEFVELCKQYEEISGMSRESSTKEFDESLCMFISEQKKAEAQESIEKIDKVVKAVFSEEADAGYVAFAGSTINVKDFCLIGVHEFDISVRKC